MKNTNKKTIIAIIIIILLVVMSICAILIPKLNLNNTNGLYAIIDVSGKIEREINLTTAEDQEIEIITPDNHKIKLLVEDHKIRFLSSDCPDKVCVHTGWLAYDYDVAACLPNQVTVYITSK